MTFTERLRALPPSGQFALAAAMIIMLAAILGGAYLLLRPRYEVLFSDLRPADAATIVAELDRTNTPYRLQDGGSAILVPQSRLDETRLAVTGADLPLKGSVGFELFNKSDMGLTEFAQRINYQRALQGELARTIMTIDSVDTARVHLTLPEPSIFRADRRPAEASVTLTPRPGRALSPETIQGVQRLVAASVPELDISGVVVLDGKGVLVGGAAPADAAPQVAAGLQQARAIEDYYAAALLSVLEPLYPQVVVRVSAPADQWAVGAARDEALAAWTPDQRAFRLRVEVSAPGGLTPSQRDDIGRLVAARIRWSVEGGDALVFPEWTALPVPGSPSAVTATAPAPAAPADASALPATGASVGWWVTVGAALLAIAAILGFVLRRRNDRRLTARQKDAYVARLRRLLSEGAGHAG